MSDPSGPWYKRASKARLFQRGIVLGKKDDLYAVVQANGTNRQVRSVLLLALGNRTSDGKSYRP